MSEHKKRGRPAGSKNKPKEDAMDVGGPVPKRPIRSNSRLPDDFVYKVDEDTDRLNGPFAAGEAHVPDGMSYQWITDSIFGQHQPQRRSRFERKGWLPVPAERHDGVWTPRGYDGEINVDGCVLMERPAEYTKMARDHDKRKAREQVWIKEQQLRGGDVGVTLDSQHRSALNSNKISKSYEPIRIPDE
jgi:hypothetical protein